MNQYLSRLNPSERRFVVGVALAFFVVLNIFWVWPHFSDWGTLKNRLTSARGKLANYQAVIQQAEHLKLELARLEGEGASVPAEDQATEVMRTIQMQAGQNGVGITRFGPQTTRTNQFFSEQSQTISGISGEKQLVDFLYNLGSGSSLIRVRAISVRPDPSRQQLDANITLVASYQKNPQSRPATVEARAAAPPKTVASPIKPASSPSKPPSLPSKPPPLPIKPGDSQSTKKK
jgi:Tfp pilus assembly protein PilO